jgi:hypothetical protein
MFYGQEFSLVSNERMSEHFVEKKKKERKKKVNEIVLWFYYVYIYVRIICTHRAPMRVRTPL